MPTWWIGRPVVEIAVGLQDLLVTMLRADAVTVELDERFTGSDWLLAQATSTTGDDGLPLLAIPRLRPRGAAVEAPSSRRVATLPIGLDGELGRVQIGVDRADFPERFELLLMQVAANQAATSLQHADLLSRHQQAERQLGVRAAQQAVVARLGLRALRDASLDGLLNDVVAEARQAIGADYCDITELSPDARRLQVRAVDGWPSNWIGVTYETNPETVAGRAVLTASPVHAIDLHGDSRFAGGASSRPAEVRGSVSVVIHCPRGPFGVLGAHSRAPREFADDDVHFLQSVANLLAAAIERLRTEAEREDLLLKAAAAQSEAERASSAKSQFLGIMSHELRTPLNAIGGYAQLMEDEISGPVTAEQRAHLGRIRRSQRHLLNVVDNVLGFLKLGSGRMHYDVTDVVVQEILQASEELTRPMMAAKRLRYSRGDIEDHLRVRADGPKLQQILVNLLSNATKFTDAEGSVCVDCQANALTVSLRVTDTGSGIPPERLESVFVPFMQVEGTRRPRVEGTGLGLAISRDFAAGMGGQLLAESVLGKGSTFSIVMPRL